MNEVTQPPPSKNKAKREIQKPDIDNAGLTKEQYIAAQALYKYLTEESEYDLMLLQGYAGTGKTFTISLVIEMFLTSEKATNMAITAPVNKAVKILRNAANYQDKRLQYMTVHSLLGLKPKISKNGEQEFVQDFDVPAKIEGLQVLVLDEVSMLNDELYAMLHFYVIERGLKIIFVGDPAQIPPIQSKNHKSDNAAPLLKSYQERDKIGVVSLTEIVRQKGTNPIIALATDLRNDLKRLAPLPTVEHVEENGEGITTLTIANDSKQMRKYLREWFTSEEFANDSDHAKVVAWTNRTVDAFNEIIRKMRFGKDVAGLVVGDKLIADVPIIDNEEAIKTILFSTNDEFTVVGFDVREKLLKGREQWGATHTIKYYWAEVQTDDQKMQHIRILHEDSQEEFKQMLNVMIELAKEKTKEGKGGGYWKDYYAMLENFAQVKYNYAISAHKSQGSTYKNVMVVEADIDANRKIVERNRIKYTAITRPSSFLVVVK